MYGARVEPTSHGYSALPHAGEPVAANRFGTQFSLRSSRMAMLLAVPTTLNTAKAPSPSLPTSSVMFELVLAGLYSSSLSTTSILYFLPATSTPPASLILAKYAL